MKITGTRRRYKATEFSKTKADDFLLADLRRESASRAALDLNGEKPEEVYQLAADMGGMGFIHSAECEIMRNSALININLISAAAEADVPRYFFCHLPACIVTCCPAKPK